MSRQLIVAIVGLSMAVAGTTSGQTSDKLDSGEQRAEGYRHRAQQARALLVESGGGDEETERAVGGAVNWLARHQNPNGSWGCAACLKQCKDPSCAKDANKDQAQEYPIAATAFGLLPFLAAGQSHETNGPYKGTVNRGLAWLTRDQDVKTGRLGTGSMYEHALGTMTLCEAYGLTRDPKLQAHAQAALMFLQDAQNDKTGGWHYAANPPTDGDLSVTGWQIMALKSGEMAGLKVDPQTYANANRFLSSVSQGKSNGLASYLSETGPTPTMTAVGLVCKQNLGLKRDDPAQAEATTLLMANLLQSAANPYFEYYATQAMHNLPGKDWEQWNETVRKRLVAEQAKEGCAAGSWSPAGKPHVMGRLMATSFGVLTLEVYYRYRPVYEPEKTPQP